ncbi:MAG: T9SS type A sorting domain-containing protein, partial [Bacteroidales bacterium]|nr:T9SS type A sorting domain-containing protein [Bacteroidales bacterium]
ISDVYPVGDGKYSIVNITKGISIGSDELIVYPNPATDIIYIVSTKEVEYVSIFNNIGQTIYRGNETQIDISNFEPGIYIISINNENEVLCKKLLIE